MASVDILERPLKPLELRHGDGGKEGAEIEVASVNLDGSAVKASEDVLIMPPANRPWEHRPLSRPA